MQGLHLSINDVKLIDLKNARFMYGNGYRTPWENDDNTRWAYNSSNTLSSFPNLQHEISPSNFLNSLKKKYVEKKTTCWRNIHHRLGDSPSCFFRMKFHDKSRPNLKISRPLGSFASGGDAEFLSFPENKSNENTVLLISITSISLCCFLSDCFLSVFCIWDIERPCKFWYLYNI